MAMILGLDYGTARIGCALSDDTESVAVSAGVFPGGTLYEAASLIQALIQEKGIRLIVVGMPIAMSGKETQQSEATRSFVHALQGMVTVPIEIYDERMTSSQADRSKGVGTVDERAAVILLQAYLDQKRTERERT